VVRVRPLRFSLAPAVSPLLVSLWLCVSFWCPLWCARKICPPWPHARYIRARSCHGNPPPRKGSATARKHGERDIVVSKYTIGRAHERARVAIVRDADRRGIRHNLLEVRALYQRVETSLPFTGDVTDVVRLSREEATCR